MKNVLNYFLICFSLLILCSCSSKNNIWLDEFDLTAVKPGIRIPKINESVAGTPLLIGNIKFSRGVGTQALSTMLFDVHGKGQYFRAKVGVDDSSEKGSANFYVLGDKKILWESGLMRKGDAAKLVDLDIRNVSKLGLLVLGGTEGSRRDYGDWAEAQIKFSGPVPTNISGKNIDTIGILTPPAPQEPRINGPKIYGMRPGKPFLYRIPVTGERPINFEVTSLPGSLKIDKEKGIISGSISKPGTYNLVLGAKNSKGESTKPLKIVVGETLALTPPMGWNSWYIHYYRVSDSIMRQAADVMISSGMADFGYQYVNIDDCWMRMQNSNDPNIGGPTRDKEGQILPNSRFPDMKRLTSYIHQKGLKTGLYTSPGPETCQGYAGSLGFERKDARTFASWGFDFLKYDWCSYRTIIKEKADKDYMGPYKLMWDELQKVDRDIVFNLCQYGLDDVWKWGGKVGNCWRTTGDLGLASSGAMPNFFYIGMNNALHNEYAHPGAWNDPDYILIGSIGSASRMGTGEKTSLIPDEQYSYMSMWSLMAAPLIFSGDMGKLDDFTLNVLCNNEVIDIDQDMLGQQAKILKYQNNELIMVKDLEDGSKAVGLFNVSENPPVPSDYFYWGSEKSFKKIELNLSEIGITGKVNVRDVWSQKKLGTFEKAFEADVPYHGVALIKIEKQ